MLPAFRYHPDPLATGNVKPSDTTCVCCGQARGHVYTGSVYGPGELRGKLCPWCIASGAAALKYKCFFSVDDSLVAAKLAHPIVLEVTRKTPGYSSWQQEEWQVCCDDACAFYGDATKEQLAAMDGALLDRHLKRWRCSPERWRQLVAVYEPGGAISIFRFVCLHCGEPTYAIDMA